MNLFAVLRNRLHRYLRRLTGRHRDLTASRQSMVKKKKKVTVVKNSGKRGSIITSPTTSPLTVIIALGLLLFILGMILLIGVTTPSGSHNHHLQQERQQQDHHLHIEPRVSEPNKIEGVIAEEPNHTLDSKNANPSAQIESSQSEQDHHQHKHQEENALKETDFPDVDVLALGRVTSDAERAEREAGYARHAFNTLISDRLGHRRHSLPDTRHELCKKGQRYDEVLKKNSTADNGNGDDDHRSELLTTSVIICFHNEHFSTLQRTVYSVLDRTPRHLLHEVILVDDHSNETLVQQLAHYFEEQSVHAPSGDYFTKVHLRRLPERAGLIRARLYGARFATGAVLAFLDSHCEVNRAWLEPLLGRIARSPATIACPIIDLIDADTLQYRASPLVRGGFNWGLHFKWDSVEELNSPEDFIRPVPSPTMAGGLFAVGRRYFHQLGGYDEGMRIWGGENLELSFRVWMCGGRLEIVPCSRVGHIFRRRRPYGDGDGDDKNKGTRVQQDTLAYNSLRVAHVWMDEYKKYFLASRSDLAGMDYGDIQSRVELRHRRLNCSTFEWYLRTVYPELQTPDQVVVAQAARENDDKNSLKPKKNLFRPATPPPTRGEAFRLQLEGSSSSSSLKLCLQASGESTFGRGAQGLPLLMAPCSRAARLQRWRRTAAEDIRLGPKACLAVGGDRRQLRPRLSKCHQQGGTQLWQVEKVEETAQAGTSAAVQLYNPGSGLCLGVVLRDVISNNADQSKPSVRSLEDLVGDELLKPAAAAELLQLKMSFCETTKTKTGDQKQQYTHWKMMSI